MKEITLFTINAPYRESTPVNGWLFGNPEEKSLAIMGSMRGNEIQQMYICARLVQELKQIEANGMLAEDCGILVVPCANQFSMNVGTRFWAADHTDINRMFPGYNLGETTQRIADRIFNSLMGYTYGVQMASFYLPGDFLPHVRVMETGYERIEDATAFGLPHVVLRHPQPYDTTTLNYNWQIWNTQAYSLYSKATESIDEPSATIIVNAVLRFLSAKGLSSYAPTDSAYTPTIEDEGKMETILSSSGGYFFRHVQPGDMVQPGDIIADILDPYTCGPIEQLRADRSGHVFFAHKAELIAGHEVAFRILLSNES